MTDKKLAGYEMPHYTEHDLYEMDKESVVWAYCLLQDKFEHLRDCEYVDLKERYRILTVRIRLHGFQIRLEGAEVVLLRLIGVQSIHHIVYHALLINSVVAMLG